MNRKQAIDMIGPSMKTDYFHFLTQRKRKIRKPIKKKKEKKNELDGYTPW